MLIIRIAGLMRSGSNLLTWMLRNNFDSVGTATMLMGWKHGPIFREQEVLSLDDFVDPRYRDNIRAFVREHPERWQSLTSSEFYQAAVHQQADASYAVALAVRSPTAWYSSCLRVSEERPGFLNHGTTPAEAARVWNDSHRSWLENLGPRGTVVNTEVLRNTPEPILERLATELNITRRTELRVPDGYIRPRSQEELYELLGMGAESQYSGRQFTRPSEAGSQLIDDFAGLLDANLVGRLGLDESDKTV